MFIEAIVLGLVVALLRKGRFRNIGRMHIKGWYLFIIGGIIQLAISLLRGLNNPFITDIFDEYFVYIHMFTYILMIIGIALNFKKTFMKFILIGVLLNFIVIFANGGQMPVSFKGAKGYEHYTEAIPDKPFDIKHKIIDEDTKFPYLADVIPLSRPYPLARIISIGDISIMIGVYLFFQESMVLKKKYRGLFYS